MMQVGSNQSTNYHSQPSLTTSGGQPGRSSSTSRQQQSQYDNEQLENIRPRLCTLRKWPHYDGYGVHLARNQHWLGLRIGDVEPNSPAESGGLLREDVVLSVNGHTVENDDFFVILSFIQHELEDDQIRFLVLDPHSADLVRRNHLNIDENYRTCVKMETPALTVSPEKLLYDQWRTTNNIVDPTVAQNTIHLGPTTQSNQNQLNTNNQRYQQKVPHNGRDDVYTFLPYSDRAIENGKSFFDVLFDQEDYSSSTPQQRPPQPRAPIQHPSTKIVTGDVGHEDDADFDDENYPNKDKKRGSIIRDGVKNLVKSGLDNIKSVLPLKHHDDKEKSDYNESRRKSSLELKETSPNTTEHSSLIDKLKHKFEKPVSPTNIPPVVLTEEEQKHQYNRLWASGSQEENDADSNLTSEPRMCSLTIRPGIDSIGISVQPDNDFGHIIKNVEPNSPADHAGIQRDDCILSLNDTPLLNIPYDDVLNVLRKRRNEPNLDFLVAKKSYLLKSRQNKTLDKYTDNKTSNTTGEVMPSSNLGGKTPASTIPPTQVLEQLLEKYNTNDPKSSFNEPTNRPRETVSTSTSYGRYDQPSPQLDSDRYRTKQQQQGQILQGVGPATADRSSWGVASGKSADDLPPPISGDSSLRSNPYGRRPDTDDTKGRHGSLEEAFKPLQVGITNPTQQSGNTSPDIPHDGQRTSRPTSSYDEQRDTSPKILPSSGIGARGVDSSSSPGQTSSTLRDSEQGGSQSTPTTQSDVRLGSSKAISVPSKPIKAKTTMAVHNDDTDDDDLSDISERSREEDISDPVMIKNLQHNVNDKKDKPNSDTIRTPISGIFASDNTFNSADTRQNPNDKRNLPSAQANADQQAPTYPRTIVQARRLEQSDSEGDIDRFAPTNTKTIVQARRLEQSDSEGDGDKNTPINTRTTIQARRLEQTDSEGTTSGADSMTAKQSVADSFYSPDTSIRGIKPTDDQNSNTWRERVENEIDSIPTSVKTKEALLSQSANQQRLQDDSDDDDDDARSEHSSDDSLSTPVPYGKMALAQMPIEELKDHGYELHDIQLMQPTETSPVGLKLTKQQDPLQYIITAIAKGTKADLAGLKINDWLIKIEDNDIRLVDFAEVSQDIRQLLTNSGLINMVIARKKTPSSSPTMKYTDKQQASSSRSDSINRQQKGQTPTSILTADITRDKPDNNQPRFVPDVSTSPPIARSQRSAAPTRETNVNAPGGPFSVGLTNPISDENQTRSPRSQSSSPSHSPTREYTVNQQPKGSLSGKPSDAIDPKDIRHVVLKEALGLDFNSFIPEGESEIQTHFISNVQPSSMADKAGLRDGDRILTVNGVDVTNSIHEDVRRMMQSKKPLQLSVFNDPKYLELIENVKQKQNKAEDSNNQSRSPIKNLPSDSGSDSNILPPKSSSPKPATEDLSKYLSVLFKDDAGVVQAKHCILKKDPSYNGYGLLLRYQNGLHLIDQVEEDSPAFNAGLREDDVILYVDKKNVEQMTHDDVKILIRKLSLSNTNIDLVLLKKSEIQRYKAYQEKNTIDFNPIFKDKLNYQINIIQTEQQPQESNPPRSSNDQTSAPPKYSEQSAKQQAPPPPPTGSTTESSPPTSATRTCILQPSAERTAGFALSGKSPPPYIICQIENNSPAEKAGLHLNDALLSINGKSVTETTYEETVKLIKEALQQKNVELVVREQPKETTQNPIGSQTSSISDQAKFSMGSNDSNNLGTSGGSIGGEATRQGRNAVEEYQIQRNKELSYTLRLCHLHPTNGDGTQAATFGFELSEEADYEYPIILHVDHQSPAEGAGLQSRDILLKINERKTKGLGYEKVKKEIEKAKRDGKLDMLVVDQETFAYCKKANKPLKEPDMKVKHIFPKTEYDAPPKTTISLKARAPSPPTVRVGHNRFEAPRVSQSLDAIASNINTAPASSIHDTVRSTISTGSFDYLRGPRRCVLRVDRNKGLGFVLSATGDYDHTITAVEKYSAADIAGLQINDEVLEVDGVDVRNVKYEQVVEMLVSAMRTNDTIEMRVIDGHSRDVYPTTNDTDKQTNSNSLLNTNNNNNTLTTTTIHSKRTTVGSGDDLSDINSSISPFDSLNQQKIAKSYPNLPGQLRQLDNVTNRSLSGSVPALATGITASPHIIHPTKSISTSSERGSVTKLSDISSQDAPVARLCRIRKFPTSPFYGFFLCGDPKKLGRVFISDVTKHSPAAVCGLRDGDRIVEINGSTIDTSTYETILDKIKQHMAHDDLELLVLDKKSLHWYRERNYPISSRTLPTIVHIEPIINDSNTEILSSEIPTTHTKMVGFADRRVSKTGL